MSLWIYLNSESEGSKAGGWEGSEELLPEPGWLGGGLPLTRKKEQLDSAWLYMCPCVCPCMYVYMYVCKYVSTCALVYGWLYWGREVKGDTQITRLVVSFISEEYSSWGDCWLVWFWILIILIVEIVNSWIWESGPHKKELVWRVVPAIVLHVYLLLVAQLHYTSSAEAEIKLGTPLNSISLPAWVHTF